MKILNIFLAVGLLLVLSGLTLAQDCTQTPGAGNLLVNSGLELCGIASGGDDIIPFGWEMDESIMQTPANGNETLAEPAFYSHRRYNGDGGNDIGRFWNMWFKPYVGTFTETLGGVPGSEDNFAHLFQDVPGTPGMQYTMTGFAAFELLYPGGVDKLNLDTGMTPNGAPFNDGEDSPTDTFFALEFLDSMGAVLPGSMEVELKANGQLPSPTSTWTNANWTQHTLVGVAPAGTTHVRVRASMIDGVLNPSLPSPQSFNMSAFVDAFSLTAVEGPSTPGDFDGDGDIDGRDFLLWQRGGSPNPFSAGDLSEWQGAYNGGALGAFAVPEPTTLACLALCFCCVGMRRTGRLLGR